MDPDGHLLDFVDTAEYYFPVKSIVKFLCMIGHGVALEALCGDFPLRQKSKSKVHFNLLKKNGYDQ